MIPMLRCINEEKETLIASTFDEISLRKQSREKRLFCPNCENNVIFKKGKKVRPHFAHYKSDCVVTNYEPETDSHIKGKEIMFHWLSKKFPTAEIQYEVYIPETKQIADILVTHTVEELKGLRWAFEFQHSPLSSTDWRKRHDLYQSAGIQDFWILDEAKFMKFSTAQGITDARLRKDLETEIFSETGLCYFLNLENSNLTIDFEFTSSYETRRINGRDIRTEYIYHSPIDHSCHINQVNITVIKQFLYGVLTCKKLEERMKSKLIIIRNNFIRKEQKRLEEELKQRANEKRTFAQIKYGEEWIDTIWEFMKHNKEEFAEDIRHLREKEFFNKYDELIKKLLSIIKEFRSWKDDNELINRLLYKITFESTFYELSFLANQTFVSLQEQLIDKNREKIELVTYVYEKYKEVLEKLSTYRAKYINNELERIHSSLKTWGDNLTAIDYAIEYRWLKSKEQADDCIEQINKRIINYNPFSDIED
jgi:competence protein CoiA